MGSKSLLQQARLHYQPKLPTVLEHVASVSFVKAKQEPPQQAFPQIAALFPLTHQAPYLECAGRSNEAHPPLRVGIVLSGGQAPGGHTYFRPL